MGEIGLQYGAAWLARYAAVAGTDKRIVDAEMREMRRWFASRYPAETRQSLHHLDLGTCTGRYLRWGLSQGFRIICGVDASMDAVAYCSRLCRPGRLCVHHADFLHEPTVSALFARHPPFHLVTMMMGTINHVAPARQGLLLQLLGEALHPEGRLLVSAWRPGACGLSLYSPEARNYLESTGLAPELLTSSASRGIPGLQMTRQLSTPWHVLVEFSRRGSSELVRSRE